MFEIGAAYTIRKTDRNVKNGLPAGKTARITFVDPQAISLYIDAHNVPDIKVPRPAFGFNFEEQRNRLANAGYKASQHASREYK